VQMTCGSREAAVDAAKETAFPGATHRAWEQTSSPYARCMKLNTKSRLRPRSADSQSRLRSVLLLPQLAICNSERGRAHSVSRPSPALTTLLAPLMTEGVGMINDLYQWNLGNTPAARTHCT